MSEVTGKIVYIQNVRTGTVLTPNMVPTDPNVIPSGIIYGSEYHTQNSTWQEWKIEPLEKWDPPNECRILSRIGEGSLDLGQGSPANGTQVYLWKTHESRADNQRWRLFKVDEVDGHPVYKIQNKLGHTYVDLANGEPNASVVGWQGTPDASNPNQLWKFVVLPGQ